MSGAFDPFKISPVSEGSLGRNHGDNPDRWEAAIERAKAEQAASGNTSPHRAPTVRKAVLGGQTPGK
jgi:hypothetical protein